ncbi:MAG: hypothetical protein WEF50_11760 [Myxococcota bacterium]
MKRDDERERGLSAEDARLIAAIDAGLRPEPISPARRAAFRAALDERIARGANPWRWLAPALAATAAVALWLARPVATPTEPVALAEPALEDAELYAFMDYDAVAAELLGSSTYLPDDYRALALLIESEEGEP